MQKLPINPFLDFYATPDAMIINPFVFGGGAFDPLSLSPALWLDASDSSTLYDAVSGGSLVAANGAIARWEDKSGNGYHCTQSDAANSPLRKTAIQNGLDCVLFDGSNDQLVHSIGNLGDCTIFAVTKKLSDQAGYRGIFSCGDSMLLSRTTTSGKWGIYNGAEVSASTDAGTSDFHILAIVDNAGSGGYFFFDGSYDGFWTNDNLGQGGCVGGLASQSTHSYIAEILVFPTALSTTDRQAVENYLNAKYAIY